MPRIDEMYSVHPDSPDILGELLSGQHEYVEPEPNQPQVAPIEVFSAPSFESITGQTDATRKYDQYGHPMCIEDDPECKIRETNRINSVYSLKYTTPLDNRSLNAATVANSDDCPIFKPKTFVSRVTQKTIKRAEPYVPLEIIGKGMEGLVIKVQQKVINERTNEEILRHFAIKFVDHKGGPENEIRVAYLLTNMLGGTYKIDYEFCNFIKIYEWTRCSFALRDFLLKKGKLKKDDVNKYVKQPKKGEDGKSVYYMSVFEFAEGGTVQEMMQMFPKTIFTSMMMTSLITQVVATLDNLVHEIGLTVYDIHTSNILIQPINEKNNPLGYTHLKYQYHLEGEVKTLYLPLVYGDVLWKLNDFGLAYINIKDRKTNATLVEVSGSAYVIGGQSEDFMPTSSNILADLHKFGIRLVKGLFEAYAYDSIDPMDFVICFMLIFPLVFNRWKTQLNRYRYNNLYNVYIHFMDVLARYGLRDDLLELVLNRSRMPRDSIPKMDEIKDESVKSSIRYCIKEAINFSFEYPNPGLIPNFSPYDRLQAGGYFESYGIKTYFDRLKDFHKYMHISPGKVKDMVLKLDYETIDYTFTKTKVPENPEFYRKKSASSTFFSNPSSSGESASDLPPPLISSKPSMSTAQVRDIEKRLESDPYYNNPNRKRKMEKEISTEEIQFAFDMSNMPVLTLDVSGQPEEQQEQQKKKTTQQMIDKLQEKIENDINTNKSKEQIMSLVTSSYIDDILREVSKKGAVIGEPFDEVFYE